MPPSIFGSIGPFVTMALFTAVNAALGSQQLEGRGASPLMTGAFAAPGKPELALAMPWIEALHGTTLEGVRAITL